MPKALYVFDPNANVTKGPHDPDSPIVIQANNMAFSDVIPNQFKNSWIKDLVNCIKSCPLHYAFCDFSKPFCFSSSQIRKLF